MPKSQKPRKPMTRRIAHAGYKAEFSADMIDKFTHHALKTIEHIRFGVMDIDDIFRAREFVCYVFVALMSRGSFSEEDKEEFSKLYHDAAMTLGVITDRHQRTGKVGCTGDEKKLLIECIDIAHQLIVESVDVCISAVIPEYLCALRILNDKSVPDGTLTEKIIKGMVKEEADKITRVSWIKSVVKKDLENKNAVKRVHQSGNENVFCADATGSNLSRNYGACV